MMPNKQLENGEQDCEGQDIPFQDAVELAPVNVTAVSTPVQSEKQCRTSASDNANPSEIMEGGVERVR